MVLRKNPPGKSPRYGVRVRVRVSLGIKLGLEYERLFPGDFFLEPAKIPCEQVLFFLSLIIWFHEHIFRSSRSQ